MKTVIFFLPLLFHTTFSFVFKSNYTIDEYLDFFNKVIDQDQLSDYITLAYTPEQGIHTLAGKKAVEKYY